MIIYYLIALIIIIFDQWTKYWTVTNIPLHETIDAIPGLFSLTYYQNRGAAWNILEGQMWFFFIVTVIVVAAVIYYMQKNARQHPLFGVSLAFVLGGALGNFIDRMRLGYVVDMVKLDFFNFPIFNVADAALTVGIVLLFVFSFITDDDEIEGL